VKSYGAARTVVQKRRIQTNEDGLYDYKNPGVNKSTKRGVTKSAKKGRKK
jgi:hypothetical protein